MPNRQHMAALGGVLVCLALALVLYHSLAGGTLFATNYYNSYALQAENWLNGHIDIQNGETYTWLELAIYQDKYYQSFPPVPAMLMLPWVLLFGCADAVPSNTIMLLWALLLTAGVYLCCWRAGMSSSSAAYLSVFVCMGSNTFWLMTSGGVWFLAQIAGLLFAFWGIYFSFSKSVPSTALTSLCFALAVGCRPFYALLLAVWFLWLLCKDGFVWRRILSAALPAIAVAAAMMAYNFARFGSVIEFGHNYLPEFTQAEYGQFSWHYLLPNLLNLLRPVTLDSQGQLHFEIFNGFLFCVANPLFLLAIVYGIRLVILPSSNDEVNRELPMPTNGIFIALMCLLLTVCLCLHRTLGGWQFGARYMVDLFPWVILWFLSRPQWKPGTLSYTLCGIAVLFNIYGALYMLTT